MVGVVALVRVESVPVTVLDVVEMVCCVDFIPPLCVAVTNADADEGVTKIVEFCAKTSSMIKTKRKSVKVS